MPFGDLFDLLLLLFCFLFFFLFFFSVPAVGYCCISYNTPGSRDSYGFASRPGAAGEFSSPVLTFCADSYCDISSPRCYRSST